MQEWVGLGVAVVAGAVALRACAAATSRTRELDEWRAIAWREQARAEQAERQVGSLIDANKALARSLVGPERALARWNDNNPARKFGSLDELLAAAYARNAKGQMTRVVDNG